VTEADPADARFKDMTVFTDWSEAGADIAKRGFAFGHAAAGAAN